MARAARRSVFGRVVKHRPGGSAACPYRPPASIGPNRLSIAASPVVAIAGASGHDCRAADHFKAESDK
jgi:hypothetical protein